MSRIWRRVVRSIVSRARAVFSRSSCPRRSMWVQLSAALSGDRSSCDSVARNSSLARFERSASARASRSRMKSCWMSCSARSSRATLSRRSSSVRLRAVTSTPIPIIRVGFPSGPAKVRPLPSIQRSGRLGGTTRNSAS